ncbi:hypothetical protein ES705_07086 [subsurface metagenome]
MKKTKLVGISLLGTLLFFSFVNISHAQPSYVGVKTGDTYTWGIKREYLQSVNQTYVYKYGKDGWNIVYGVIDGLLTVLTGYNISEWVGASYRVKVTNMTEEMPTRGGTPGGVGIYTNKYIKTKTTSWLLVHSDSWPSFPSTWLCDPDPANFNESTWDWYISFLRPYLIPTEFLPLGINYFTLVRYLNKNLQSLYPFFPTNTTVTTFGALGFEITIPSSYLENIAQVAAGSLENFEINIQYPENGVCGPLRYRYGRTLFEFGLVSGGEEIPGYTLSIILGTGAVGIISLIYIIRRKDRLE